MLSKLLKCWFMLTIILASSDGYRNTASEVRFVDELLNDGEESNHNSIIQTTENKRLSEAKRSVEDSDLITNTFENNEDDLMAVENTKNNVDNTAYAFHEPSVSNYESDDLMSVASPALITADDATEAKDLMSHIANEHEDILEAVASKSEIIEDKMREKRSKANDKNNKRSKTSHQSGDLSSIFSEIQSSKHHKLTRSDIRKLAKHAVLLATLGKTEAKSEKASKKSITKSKKITKKAKSKTKTKKTNKKKKKQKDHIMNNDVKESTANINSLTHDEKESTANIHSLMQNESVKSEKKESNKDSKTVSDTETPGVNQNNDNKKPLMETTDGKETKAEVVAESVDTKETKVKGVPSEKNNTEEISNVKDDKPILSISGKDMDSNNDTVATVIKNSKDAWNKTSEFSEDLTSKVKKLTMDEFSDDALFNAITKNNTPVLDNKTFTMDSVMKLVNDKTISELKPSLSPATPKEKDSIKTTSSQTNPITASSQNKTNKQNISDDVIVKKSEIARVETPGNTNNTISNETKKSEVPENNDEIKRKINKLKDIISKTTPDKIPEQFLPELPSGLRMIAWKQLLEKKKKQLAELVSAYPAESPKPVTINIDVDAKNHAEAAKTQNPMLSDSNMVTDNSKTGTKKTALPADNAEENTHEEKPASISSDSTSSNDTKLKPEDLNSHHVKYLQKHIKSARSLRKLIAKTLIGHCKSTGKRILEAFIAMDKALERAQAIAEVIGKKFHVNSEKIQNLVGSKEDEVVETFLRDIFTKL